MKGLFQKSMDFYSTQEMFIALSSPLKLAIQFYLEYINLLCLMDFIMRKDLTRKMNHIKLNTNFIKGSIYRNRSMRKKLAYCTKNKKRRMDIIKLCSKTQFNQMVEISILYQQQPQMKYHSERIFVRERLRIIISYSSKYKIMDRNHFLSHKEFKKFIQMLIEVYFLHLL